MGFLDALLGRTKPAQANLDKLFGLPGAQITLEASEGIQPTGQAGVCFKPAEGQAFASTETEFTALLDLGDDAGGEGAARSSDQYGYRWVVLAADDFQTLVTRGPHDEHHAPGERLRAAAPLLGLRLRADAPGGRAPTGGLDLPRLPLQARDLLPLRTGGRRDDGTTRSSSG